MNKALWSWAVIAVYALAAITNLVTFLFDHQPDKLVIAILFAALIGYQRAIANYRKACATWEKMARHD